MFIVDDLLRFPTRSFMFLVREIHRAAQEEIAQEGDAIRDELSELYMLLETGRITEEEFDRKEQELLDRLDAHEGRDTSSEGPTQ